MPRVFAYCRVSTVDQTTQNQRMEIKAAGFAVESRRLIEENISGSVAAKERPGFMKLIDRMESGDVLVVTKLDRLGRNAMDVWVTVEQLAKSGNGIFGGYSEFLNIPSCRLVPMSGAAQIRSAQ